MTDQERIGFGIPFLAELVRIRMEKHGRSLDVAIDTVARGCELRSEAIQALREYLQEQSQ